MSRTPHWHHHLQWWTLSSKICGTDVGSFFMPIPLHSTPTQFYSMPWVSLPSEGQRGYMTGFSSRSLGALQPAPSRNKEAEPAGGPKGHVEGGRIVVSKAAGEVFERLPVPIRACFQGEAWARAAGVWLRACANVRETVSHIPPPSAKSFNLWPPPSAPRKPPPTVAPAA